MKHMDLMDLNRAWETALAEIELQISRPNFATWLKNSRLADKKDGTATVALPNNFAKEWVKTKYHKIILAALRNLDNETKNVQYEVHPSLIKEQKAADEIQNIEMQNIIPEFRLDPETNLSPRYTFESFVVGTSNELACAAAYAVIKEVGTKYNPLFIYGGVGLGKTHLIQAIGNEIKKTHKEKLKIKYVTSEKFTNEVVWAIRNKRMDDIKQKYRDTDVLIIDDIQFIGGKEKTEEEFFHTFNVLYESKKQIIISSDRPPRSIPTLEERLRSRFASGMIADIGFPDYETRLAILKTKLDEQNRELDEEILSVIAKKVQRNIRELEGVLNKILFHLDRKKSDITPVFVEKIIENDFNQPAKNVTINDVLKAVADYFNVPSNDFIGRCRKREIVEPRQIAMYLLREEMKLSYPHIGEKLGNRDHTTVIHAYEKISKEITKNPSLNQKILYIKDSMYKNS
ncbi:hypothetical protein A3A20_02675 [Candidatus Wolfebacteria bacterium RIFCSPLOWO2_01_FULL_45_19]|uniref:Chromosomal replication initiator protein DnaA n=1 Tax=Candidatus Wolfebacteria bacterium RIFCSPLOWO2_01_FULL_45_19 TaxID=1802557 RepID=A0A1F8DSM0_9BACT|nr:MAG: Chromosomal replication initiator protein DnaA [Parcubacteria group bacterium GW2011_GWB1_45_9]OGM91452.1 MAG: hypothetical protein A3A20_02675 [Candidatus Wolfebacteria bacterium RIFCSPLOWO2_01_FULL_45_19]